jgi:hypothetical protein
MPDSLYRPNPIDTSHVDLGPLEPLVEALSKNAHEIWARERMRDGWTFGPSRNDQRKEHPCLISYEDLPDSEKVYDREMVKEVLKATIALGFRIVQ